MSAAALKEIAVLVTALAKPIGAVVFATGLAKLIGAVFLATLPKTTGALISVIELDEIMYYLVDSKLYDVDDEEDDDVR